MSKNKNDISDFIHRVRDIKDETQSDEIKITVYTVLGKGDIIDSKGYSVLQNKKLINGKIINAEVRDSAYAKIVIINKQKKYYVKQNNGGRLFNPIGLFAEESPRRKLLRHMGLAEWHFKEVDKMAFDYYINFLKTKNLAHLRYAERAII